MYRVIIILCLIATPVSSAEQPTPQQIAQSRADWIVQHNYRWHPSFKIGTGPKFWLWDHVKFEGLGFGESGAVWKRMGTCRPKRRGMRLVGDAYASNERMSCRVRLWK